MKVDPAEITHSERHGLLGNLIIPRPIAFVSTISADGIFNLAPFSMFGLVCYHPATIYFTVSRWRNRKQMDRADGSMKDTRVNIGQTKEFVVNMVTEEIAQQMNTASGVYSPEVDEFQVSGLTPVPSDIVKVPRVKESPVNLECRTTQILEFGKPDITAEMVFGEILRIHIRDDVWGNGKIDADAYRVIGRMGWGRYTRTRDLFKIEHVHKLPP